MFLNKFCFSFSPLKYGFSDRERYCNAYMYYYTYYAKSSFKSVYKFDIKLDQAPISIHLQTHWLIDACTRTATGNFDIISRPFIWGKKIYFILTHRQLVWKILIKFNFHFFSGQRACSEDSRMLSLFHCCFNLYVLLSQFHWIMTL